MINEDHKKGFLDATKKLSSRIEKERASVFRNKKLRLSNNAVWKAKIEVFDHIIQMLKPKIAGMSRAHYKNYGIPEIVTNIVEDNPFDI